jgi:hypothetical protein
MKEPPQFVDWATTEGEREEFGCAIWHLEQRLGACIRRTIRAQWNLNFAWRQPLLPGGPPRSSAASVLAHSALSVDQSRLAAHSYGNLCALHARTHSQCRRACGAAAAVIGRTPPAVGPQRTRHGSAAHNAPCASPPVRKCERSPLRL